MNGLVNKDEKQKYGTIINEYDETTISTDINRTGDLKHFKPSEINNKSPL